MTTALQASCKTVGVARPSHSERPSSVSGGTMTPTVSGKRLPIDREAMRGRPSQLKVEIDDATRATLEGWLRRQKTPVGLATRARAMLEFGVVPRRKTSFGDPRGGVRLRGPTRSCWGQVNDNTREEIDNED